MENCKFFLADFIKLLPKFRNFINVDNCIGKIISKSIRLYADFFQKKVGKVFLFGAATAVAVSR